MPFLDIGATYRELSDRFDAAYRRVMQSGWYLLGDELEQFEAEFAASTGAEHAVGLGSGLDALILTLRALDVGSGDEVLVPSNTYVATWMAVTAVGATIVPVEPDPETLIVTATAAEAAMTTRTRVGASRPSVRAAGRPGCVRGVGGSTRCRARRRRRPGASRQLPGITGRRSRACGVLELLSGQESGRVRVMPEPSRRTTRPSPLACVVSGTTDPSRSTTTWSSARTAGSTS